MKLDELLSEIEEYQKDTNISEEERKIVTSILKAEIARQQCDEMINYHKNNINKLRIKVIKKLAQKYNSFDEERKEKAYSLIDDMQYTNYFFRYTNDVLFTAKIDNPTLNGEIVSYVDNEVHQDIENGRVAENSLDKLVEQKHSKISDQLSYLLGKDFFNFYDDETKAKYKDSSKVQEEVNKLNIKINSLDIASNIKGILRNILYDIAQFRLTYGESIYKFPELDASKILDALENNEFYDGLLDELYIDENQKDGKKR